jgi:hypothetical protein
MTERWKRPPVLYWACELKHPLTIHLISELPAICHEALAAAKQEGARE